MGHAFYATAVDERAFASTHTMLFCCWLYLCGAFVALISTNLLAFVHKETNSNKGWAKKPQTQRELSQIQQVNPFPVPKLLHSADPARDLGHSSEKPRPGEKSRSERCQPSPS